MTTEQTRQPDFGCCPEGCIDGWIVRGGIRYCHDCDHSEAVHSLPDFEGVLFYGDGECGNCTVCIAERAAA